MDFISIRAFAKINLGLRVLGLRSDGFHDIETTFQTISLADIIEIELNDSKSISLTMEPNLGIEPHENLVFKAAELFCAHSAYSGGLLIKLHKRIPTGAGLGGGSSDAAATLVALNRLFDSGHSESELTEMGLELGSDVPFFIRGGRATASGRGEVLNFIDEIVSDLHVVVVVPQPKLSTKRVYERYDNVTPSRSKSFVYGRLFQNDLEHAAIWLMPELRDVKEFLREHSRGQFGMTGSGSAFFAFAESEYEAKALKLKAEQNLDCEAFNVNLVSKGHQILSEK